MDGHLAPFAELLRREMVARSLTGAEVAEAIRRASSHRSGVTRHLVSRWCSGSVTPNRWHVRWLASALDLDLAAVANAADAQRPSPGTADVVGPLRLLPPNAAGLDYVTVIRDTTQELVRLDNLLGADDVVRVSQRLLTSVRRQLHEGRYDANALTHLQRAAAELAEMTGWLLFDSNHLDEARRTSQEGAQLAHEAGDIGMEVLALTNLALQAQFEQDGYEALRITRGLREYAEAQPPRVRSAIYMRQGRAHSLLGNRSEALNAFACAEELLLDGPRSDDPPWGWWIDDPEFRFHSGMAYAELGDYRQAVQFIRQAIDDVAPNRVRDRFMYWAHLLDVLAWARGWEDAQDAIEELATTVGEVGSGRSCTLVRRACTHLTTINVPKSVANGAGHLLELIDESRVHL